MPSHVFYFLLAFSLASAFSCADYPAPATAHTLDYLEFHDPKGWTLRIDGDGAGRLRCNAYPGRTVHYLPATFRLHQLPRHFKQCSRGIQVSSGNCLRAVFYEALLNQTQVCACPNEEWVRNYFDVAFQEIRRSPAEARDRRLIKRHWMHDPPLPARGS